MENSQPLATESFSYSWLLNQKPSIDGLTESPRPSYSIDDHEEDMKFLAYSKRFLEEAQNFNFDVHPVIESVHADEIFSDGHIMPMYFDRSKIEAFEQAFNNFNTSNLSSSTPPTPLSSRIRSQADFLEKWRKFSGRILVKWFGFIRPFCKRLKTSRKLSAKVDDLQRKVWEIESYKSPDNSSVHESPRRMVKSYSVVDWDRNCNNQRISTSRTKSLRKVKSWSNSPQVSPIRSPKSSDYTDVWRDMESSISDAIQHCKRSSGMTTECDLSKICS